MCAMPPKAETKLGVAAAQPPHDELSPMTVATAANRRAKCLILLCGGPGRTRTSNQTVISDMPYREVAIKPRSIVSDCRRSTPFVHWHSVGLLREEAPRP